MIALLWTEPTRAQDAVPPDTYGDAGVEALLARARAARTQSVEGIDSYEGRLRQRIYVGLTGQRFRRERGLFEHERLALIRWSSGGDRVIQWEGVRTAIPIAGMDSGDPESGGVRTVLTDSTSSVSAGSKPVEDMAGDLLGGVDMPGFDFDPGGDRLRFGGDDWAIHPLADSALTRYRYGSGDTLRVSLTANADDDIVLYEVLVEPRGADFHLVAGSLWFDAQSASLVRATYRPARPYNLALDDPGESDDVPGFLQPIEAEIDYITIEYSLQELQFWLPRRFAFQGEARLGGLARIPITLEWNVGGYVVNESATDLLVEGELPEGWRRQENVDTTATGDSITVTVIVPTSEELRDSPALSQTFGERSPISFSSTEIDRLERELEGLLPTYQRFRPQLAWGLQKSMVRFNRVEGLSVGTTVTIPISPNLQFEGMARVGNGDRVVNASAKVLKGPESGRWTLDGYRRLQSMSQLHDPFGLTSSVGNFVLGGDKGQYYRTTGGAVGYEAFGTRVRFSVTAFTERQRGVEFGTNFSLRGLAQEDTANTVLSADDIDVDGARGSLAWFSGINPNGLIVTSRVTGEVGTGDMSFQRATASFSASHPLLLGLAGAIEVESGMTWGDIPVQRQFFIGGSGTLRGFDNNGQRGEAFWRARAEVATGFAAARIALFSDVGWIGDRDAFAFDDPFASVGVGASLLDGLFRADLAKAVRRGSRWKLHIYLDGLF